MDRENNIDKNLYNEKTLYLLNIRDLRQIGRKFGVPAPTTLKKQDLVDYILKIVYGEMTIEKHHSYGRPSTGEFNFNEYLEKIKSKAELTDQLVKVQLDDTIFKVAAPTEKQAKTNNVLQVIFVEDGDKFYLREHGFVSSPNDIEVSKELAQKFKLENLDVVEIIKSGDTFKIISINGQVVKKLLDNNSGAKSGTRQVFWLRTKEEIKTKINKLSDEIGDNAMILVFSTNNYEGKNIKTITANEGETTSKVYKKFVSFMSLCEKFVFENENIVIVTDEFGLIQESIDSFEPDVAERIKQHVQSQLDSFLEIGNAVNIYKLEVPAKY